MKKPKLSAEELVVRAAVAWWRGHRPLNFSLKDHLAHPTINTSFGADLRLARTVARLVRGQQKPKAAPPAPPAAVYVVVTERKTQKVIKRMGPMSATKANRVRDGIDINLDHENYYTTFEEK